MITFLKLTETHPEVYLEFKNKLFGIKQTPKYFSSSPIDLVLQQTINADAACQRTGVSALTNSISARQRRTDSHFLRTAMKNKFFEDLSLSMTKKEDVSSNLRPHQTSNDHADLNKVIVMTLETMNPFDVNLDPDKLYNIGTGLAAMDLTQSFLLNVFQNGENERKKIIEEYSRESRRFEKHYFKKNYLTCYRNWEAGNNFIRQKSFISMFNAQFVWEHFIHIVTKEG